MNSIKDSFYRIYIGYQTQELEFYREQKWAMELKTRFYREEGLLLKFEDVFLLRPKTLLSGPDESARKQLKTFENYVRPIQYIVKECKRQMSEIK